MEEFEKELEENPCKFCLAGMCGDCCENCPDNPGLRGLSEVDRVEELKHDLKEYVRTHYLNKSEEFYEIADAVIDIFGYIYPIEVEVLIDKIDQILP